MKVAGKWRWFKLYTDKRASQKRWGEIVQESEQKRAGVITSQMEAAQRPLSEHVTAYLDGLKRIVTYDHYRIATTMLNRFVEKAGWKTLADINEQSAARVLSAFLAEDKTVAYTNQYLARVKAFINWCVPDRLIVNPLSKMRRGNIKKALKRRARRPLAERELATLLDTCPESRRLKYAFPAFTGLRRAELAEVRWGDLHLDSTIPYVQLRPEQTKTGEATPLPLHPYLADGLRELTPGMPEAKLFATLPEGRTLLRDLTNAGIQQADASGRRADYHGLRHTFAKRLDASGCSHATRRALMRHSVGDQTDGYTLSHLFEMYEAVKRLPTPGHATTEVQAKTGTADVPLAPKVDTWWTQRVPEPAFIGMQNTGDSDPQKCNNPMENDAFRGDRQGSARPGLLGTQNRDSVSESSPCSSVG
jgi:integrase